MKPITKIALGAVALFFILQSFVQSDRAPQKEVQAQTEAFKLRCCFKIGLPSIKFKRPKKDCKKGFGLCITNVYACFICTLDGSAPDCSKCGASKPGSATDIELKGTIDEEANTITLEVPASIKDLPDNADEDFSVFYLDEDVLIFDTTDPTGQKTTLKAGVYKVTENNGVLTIVINL